MAVGVPAAVCRGCERLTVSQAIDLGEQPMGDEFLPRESPHNSERWPLLVGWCEQCSLVQLIGGDAIEEQPMLAAVSRQVSLHAGDSARHVVAQLGLRPGTRFVERRSSHGGGWADELDRQGLIPVAADGPSPDGVELVVDVQWLTHQRRLLPALQSSAALLVDGGHLVLDFHHALPLVRDAQIDSFRHGHFVYLSLHALERALHATGLVVVDARTTPTFGGGLQVTAVKGHGVPTEDAKARLNAVCSAERAAGLLELGPLRSLETLARTSSQALRTHLVQALADGRRVLGYGAPSRAALPLALAGIDADLLPWTADISAAKHGRRLPGTAIEIRSPQDLIEAAPDEVLILTWDIADEVADLLVAAGLRDADLVAAQPMPVTIAKAPAGVRT